MGCQEGYEGDMCNTCKDFCILLYCLLGSFNDIFFIVLETGRTADNVLENV